MFLINIRRIICNGLGYAEINQFQRSRNKNKVSRLQVWMDNLFLMNSIDCLKHLINATPYEHHWRNSVWFYRKHPLPVPSIAVSSLCWWVYPFASLASVLDRFHQAPLPRFTILKYSIVLVTGVVGQHTIYIILDCRSISWSHRRTMDLWPFRLWRSSISLI